MYYKEPYHAALRARVVSVDSGTAELDRTIAFSEEGRQEADIGSITHNYCRIVFNWARKKFGTPFRVSNFSRISVDGVVKHDAISDHPKRVEHFQHGDPVVARINANRRYWLTLSHSASHFRYAAVERDRPDVISGTVGRHIKISAARFDFRRDNRLTPGDIQAVEDEANELIDRNNSIDISTHLDHSGVRYWHYADTVILCGGAHLECAAPIGHLVIKHKGMGKGKGRVSLRYPNAREDLSRYHEISI